LSPTAITVVGTGNSGREAIELFQKTKPDILLMDIRMGEMSGLEAAEEILKMQKTQRFCS
jgi:YesN/AraC family two-component response regulator